jgi:hypothetical protein
VLERSHCQMGSGFGLEKGGVLLLGVEGGVRVRSE